MQRFAVIALALFTVSTSIASAQSVPEDVHVIKYHIPACAVESIRTMRTGRKGVKNHRPIIQVQCASGETYFVVIR